MWTSSSDRESRPVTLKVGNIIKDRNITPGNSASVLVGVHRCAYAIHRDGRYEGYGVCDVAEIPVTVKMKERPKKYQTKARSYVGVSPNSNWGDASRTIKVKPGDNIYFKHTLDNLGDITNDSVSNVVIRANEDYRAGHGLIKNELQVNGGVVRGGGEFAVAAPSGSKQLNGGYMTYTAKSSDAGKILCSRIEFTPAVKNSTHIKDSYQDFNSDDVGFTNYACAYVSYDYEITGEVPLDGKCSGSCDREEEVGATNIPIPANIITPKPGTKIKDTNWKLSYFVVKPNNKAPGLGGISDAWGNFRNGGFFDLNNSDSDPCSSAHFSASGVYKASESNLSKKIQGCTVLNKGTINSASDKVKIDVDVFGRLNSFDIPQDAEIGTKYCFALSVSPYTIKNSWTKEQQDNFKGWHHGRPGCIVVVKKPKVQILGGGLLAGGGVSGLTSQRDDRLYGSWVEYEIVTNGANQGVASNGAFGYPNGASGFAGGTTSQKVYNRLTFANQNDKYGHFGGNQTAADFISKMKAIYSGKKETSTGSNISVSDSSADLLYKPKGKVSIGKSSIFSGTIVVYAPNQEVEISGDITQSSGVRDISNIGQMIIVAKKVKIKDSVSRVDAWILSEELNTCNSSVKLSVSVCNSQLEINGVVAISGSDQSLMLRRTAGADQSGDGIGYPAETFRLNYDAFQWIINQSQKNGLRITTTYSKEMPARF